MSKILRKKSDNSVVYLLNDSQSANLSSTKFIYIKSAGGKVIVSDCNSNTHELITDVTGPTTWWGNMFFYADDGTWTINTEMLNMENGSRQLERARNGTSSPADLEVQV